MISELMDTAHRVLSVAIMPIFVLLAFCVLMLSLYDRYKLFKGSFRDEVRALVPGTLILLALLAFGYSEHPWVTTRLELRHTREITSTEGDFSMRIPRNWTFAEGKSLMIMPRSQTFREIPITLSPLKSLIMRPDEGWGTYISAARYFFLSPRRGDEGIRAQLMFIEMSVSRVMLPVGNNLSAQELNDNLMVALRGMADVSQIRQEARMLNGHYWAITTLDFDNTTYVFWQFVDSGRNHYIIEFQTDRLSIARRTFEYIMRSFSSSGTVI